MAHPDRQLTLAGALSADVPERTRSKGYAYFVDGAVETVDGSDSGVNAVVRGAYRYNVEIARDNDGFVASCACRYFRDRFEICKHIWAVVLAADARGFLPPRGARAWIDPLDRTRSEAAPGATSRPGPRQPDRAKGRSLAWQQFLDGVSRQLSAIDSGRAMARYASGQILYVIDKQLTLAGNGVALTVETRQRKKNGEWGKPQSAAISGVEIQHLSDEADRQVLALLLGAADPYAGTTYGSMFARASFRLHGPLADRVLPLIAQSGRLHLRTRPADPQGRVLRDELHPLAWDDGAPWIFRLGLSPTPDSGYRVDGTLVRGNERMAASEPDLILPDGYLIARHTLARMEHGGAFTWLAQLRRSGPAEFPRDAASSLVETFARSNVDPMLLPIELRYDVVDVPPRPRVKVTRPPRQTGYAIREQLDASVEFEYGGTVLGGARGGTAYDPERRRMIRRNLGAEQTAVQRLQQLGFHRAWHYAESPDALSVAVDQFPRAVRTLVREGWHVEAEGRAFRAAQAMRVHVKSGIDWFELHGSVDFGEGRSASIAALLDALRRGDATVVLDDGTRGMVPEEWLRRYARIASLGEAEGDHIRYRPSQAAILDALLENQPGVSIDETFARARAELKRFSGIQPLDPPPSFTGRLREYQREALGWFEFLRRFGFGGCLADDMGLGKTVMVLALLASRRDERSGEARPSVVVVPRSLVFNWMDEASRFAPALRILDYTGASRSGERIAEYDVVLTTYGTLRRDAVRLNEHEFDYVILDEAQAIKNAATASAKAVRALRGQHRLALSGTPVENHIGELWSLFDFLNPGLLGAAAAFNRATAAQARADREDLALVARALKPLILRRTKEQVAPELPERTEQTIHCDLEAPQRRFYDELRAHYRSTLLARVARNGLARSKMQVLEALLRLRQAACHAGLVDPQRVEEPSAKFDVLVPQLAEVADEGHKALVFSQFTTLLGLLRTRLEREGLEYEYLDGKTRDRAERVEHFQTSDRCRVFLISLKAGGLGLNLTAAEYVFLLDPWWNPAVEAQAIDRAHRIGQSRQVFAYRLIARDTVEEKVAELQQSKRALADAILTADPALIRDLKPEDLDWLLS
jgi:superfamily II DNA or RNA helicase